MAGRNAQINRWAVMGKLGQRSPYCCQKGQDASFWQRGGCHCKQSTSIGLQVSMNVANKAFAENGMAVAGEGEQQRGRRTLGATVDTCSTQLPEGRAGVGRGAESVWGFPLI